MPPPLLFPTFPGSFLFLPLPTRPSAFTPFPFPFVRQHPAHLQNTPSHSALRQTIPTSCSQHRNTASKTCQPFPLNRSCYATVACLCEHQSTTRGTWRGVRPRIAKRQPIGQVWGSALYSTGPRPPPIMPHNSVPFHGYFTPHVFLSPPSPHRCFGVQARLRSFPLGSGSAPFFTTDDVATYAPFTSPTLHPDRNRVFQLEPHFISVFPSFRIHSISPFI